MRLRHLILLLLTFPLHLWAQGDRSSSGSTDTLFEELKRARTDSARITAHIRIVDALMTSDYRKALEQATLAVQLSEKVGDPALQYMAYSKAGGLCAHKGLYDLAFSFYNRHYDLARKERGYHRRHHPPSERLSLG